MLTFIDSGIIFNGFSVAYISIDTYDDCESQGSDCLPVDLRYPSLSKHTN